jgi:hypothetical protein
MDRVVFADNWQQFFAKYGLESFDDFYKYTGGTVIGRNRKRNVQKLTFGEGPGQKVFFMKRFHQPHFKDIVAALRNCGRLTSQAALEWKNAHTLLENGIDTYKPVCLGERKVSGIERMSFLITEKLMSISMLDFVVQKWPGLERPQREKIVTAMAKLVRRVHDLKISLPDLYIWHIFIYEDHLDNECRLSVIDLHRMTHRVTSSGKMAKELGKLYWSMLSEYFDDNLKDLLLSEYMGDCRQYEKDRLIRRVRKSARTSERRRSLAQYYSEATAVST